MAFTGTSTWGPPIIGDGLANTMSRYLVRRIEENPAIDLRRRSEILALEGERHVEGPVARQHGWPARDRRRQARVHDDWRRAEHWLARAYLGLDSSDRIALANRIAGRQPTTFAVSARECSDPNRLVVVGVVCGDRTDVAFDTHVYRAATSTSEVARMLMNRLMKWLFCDVDDTVRAALMLALAGAALNLTERASRRSGAHYPTNDAVGEGMNIPPLAIHAVPNGEKGR